MLWLILFAVAVLTAIALANSRRIRASTAEVGTSLARTATSSDDGLAALADGGWLLTPGLTFPLSIRGASREVTLEVKRLLHQGVEKRPSEVYSTLARLIFEHELRVDQVEDYFRENGPKYREELKRLTAGIEDGYIEDELRRKALKVLDVWLPQEPWSLFDDVEPLTVADQAAIRKFGYEVLEMCLRRGAQPGQVEALNSDDRRVAVFDRLVREGLAEPHVSIPPQDILPLLRLDEMRSMLKLAGGPPVRRKAEALSFLQGRDDVRHLLERSSCRRHFYRLVPLGEKLAGADLTRIARHLPRTWATAALLADTYSATWYGTRNSASFTASGDTIKGVEVLTCNDEAVCPCCKRTGSKKRLVLGAAPPPFHLGCRCSTVARV